MHICSKKRVGDYIFRERSWPCAQGYTLTELVAVLLGVLILLAAGAPLVGTAWNQYRIILAAQSISRQLQFARMKAVASNESFRVSFSSSQRSFQVQTSSGSAITGPISLPRGIDWNAADPGSAIAFTGNFVEFQPTGNTPASGSGSPGRVKIINGSGSRIDIVVTAGGIIRQTPVYTSPPAPF